MAKDGIGFGMATAAGAANTALGQLGSTFFGRIHDQRQLDQQKKLNKLQIAGNKELSDYERMQQMKMWNDTNYEAQIKHAKNAGMSISALYGGSGAGGATTAGGSGAGVTGAAASDPNSSTGMGLQMASQLALMEAQKENIEADTANKKAGTGATEIATDTATKGQADQLKTLKANAEKAIEDMWITTNERTISDHTLKPKVEEVFQKLTGQILQNKNLTTENKKKEAEATIAAFDAKMTEQGISTKAPWYLKMVADMLEKIGLNPLK